MLKRLYKMIPWLVLALIISAISAGFDGWVNIKIMEILDDALSGDITMLKSKSAIVLLFATLLVPLGVLVAMSNNYFKKKTNLLLKKYYISKTFQKDIAEFHKENNGKYISALTNDYSTLEANLITGIYTVANGLINFLVGIWVISSVDVRMLLVGLIVIGVNLIVSIITAKPIQKAYKERSDMFSEYTSYIKEVLSAFHIVKNYNLKEKVSIDYYEKSESIQQKGFIIERMLSFINSFQNFLMQGSFYGILCVIGYLTLIGKITPGGLLLVVTGIERMAWPLFEVSEVFPKLFSSKDLIHKIEKTLENENNYVETVDITDFKDRIAFKNVEFHYDDDERIILSDINLEFKKNGKYLIVGPSGGGKSTLLKLLRKYFNPTKGQIMIDNHDLKDVKKERFFALIANIEQQVFIFEDTIKNNLTLYKEYSNEEIDSAINAAGLREFVNNLSDGLNTIIYDNGKNISGGERSRLVIARALLSKASILLMDEAFASLDMERAREIEKTILNLKNITVINVSHVIFRDTKDLYDRVLTVKKNIL